MTILVSMAGSPGPLERTGRARKMSKTVWDPKHIKDHDLPDVVVTRPRGRPRKNLDGVPGEIHKKRGSQKSHGAEHYAEIRYKRQLAGIIHKQFLILENDMQEAERLLAKLMEKANTAYHLVSVREREKQQQIEDSGRSLPSHDLPEPDPLDDPVPAPLPVPGEPPTASLPEIEAAAVPEPAPRRKPIRERGKLSLKAFRKDPL
jgi:hypothetical protein